MVSLEVAPCLVSNFDCRQGLPEFQRTTPIHLKFQRIWGRYRSYYRGKISCFPYLEVTNNYAGTFTQNSASFGSECIRGYPTNLQSLTCIIWAQQRIFSSLIDLARFDFISKAGFA
ncbi:hypothetical protein WA026_009498 [Henosepilachna vigintioctopunctata]|uniref:Uncharacterized protein n=1 Tax=Henosepilachna vigintioctopunctata TaxID=420089 RepID=A0AAW1U6Z8_9CUCU